MQINLSKPIRRIHKKYVDISFDPGKRAETLRTRGLDFADAGMVFAGRTVSVQDVRLDYAEDRFLRPATAAVASYP